MAVMRTLIHAELPSNRDKSAGEFLQRVSGVMSETYLREDLFVTVWAAVNRSPPLWRHLGPAFVTSLQQRAYFFHVIVKLGQRLLRFKNLELERFIVVSAKPHSRP
jgi:hypothetical protein